MSRIGNRVLNIPEGVSVTVNKLEDKFDVIVKGPLGEVSQKFDDFIKIKVENNQVIVSREKEDKFTRSYHGTVNSIINGLIEGVKDGVKVELLIKGVGYKASMQQDVLTLKVGFSHDVVFKIPQGIKVELPKPTEIIITGINKQFVTQFAAKIYLVKKPEPYGGKGIMYKGQIIRRKAGKAAGGK